MTRPEAIAEYLRDSTDLGAAGVLAAMGADYDLAPTREAIAWAPDLAAEPIDLGSETNEGARARDGDGATHHCRYWQETAALEWTSASDRALVGVSEGY